MRDRRRLIAAHSFLRPASGWMRAALFCLVLSLPAVAFAGSAFEPDLRDVERATLDRLALEAGLFPPLYSPISETELAGLLAAVRAAGERLPAAEREALAVLEARYGGDRRRQWQAGGRIVAGYSELGSPLTGAAGLAFAPGWNAALEPAFSWRRGDAWAAVTPRAFGGLGSAGIELDADDPLAWPGWSIPTGRAQVGAARTADGEWDVDLPRAVAGIRLGSWAVTAGRTPRRTGPGFSGALALDSDGAVIDAATLRRIRPFVWSGPLRALGPHDLLLRAGVLSKREIRWRDGWGLQSRRTRPWFFQWLLGWEATGWCRVAFEHTAIAAAREGTLWLDLPQINFPLEGTTWSEVDAGPVTDRVFNVQLEFRWSDAPWRLLPREAGRAYWQYGGTDFHHKGPSGVIPEISVPASIAGCELVAPRWDLGFEFAELEHPHVLWYGNGGFPEGYSQQGWLLGHPLGGSGREYCGRVRWRPAGRGLETELRVVRRTWGLAERTPGDGEQWSTTCSLRRTAAAGPAAWEISLEWLHEEADPLAYTTDTAAPTRRDWGRVLLRVPYAGLPW